ncbi:MULTISPECIES: LacI family DNA-binding transcriptional regulator [Streptomyces]|uniref:LacI family transcriptional regulator n=2 Tax=Streptomyces TaxID=1883 RepID=A0A2N8PLF6_STRNR|nr:MULTISPECIES: LacI family DNA-binding transcriptional regulator [Streptomyces]PNE41854.1 LacI family transcriptional regulator [Streptomyces noursei]SHL95084.1 transcriptional regulator, LacI family [Streptomyces yunnanensis]
MTDPAGPEATPTPPTSAAVARRAGVSRATVSYVLNGQAAGRVGVRTQARVRAAAEELGYVPHAAARSLRAGRGRIVLLAAPADAVPAFGPLFADFLAGFQTALHHLGYTGVLHGAPAASPLAAARDWAELRPAAVLALHGPPLDAAAVELLKRSGTAAVLTTGPQAPPGAHALLLDQREAGLRAGAHLLAAGRRRIGVVLPADPRLTAFAEPRLAGVRDAAAAHPGAEVRPLVLARTEESATRLAARWPALDLDAVFAYNDEYAMLLLRALQDAGHAVGAAPGRIAVVGADDLLLARLLRPRLTTVRAETAAPDRIAHLVDALIRDPSAPPAAHRLGTFHLVPRESA